MKLAATRLLTKARKLLKLLVHPDYRAALRKGRVAAAIEHERLLKSLQCATVVDVGANRGQFALVSRHCFPQARIISFEPLSLPAGQFHAVLGTDPRVTLHQVAIGKEPGTAKIHVSRADDSSSLLPITELQDSLFPGTAEVRTETIQVTPLDTLLSQEQVVAPALLKIDVQGYELTTLQGCESLLRLFELVYVECSFVELYQGQALADEVSAYLSEHSFGLRGVYNVHYDSSGQAIQADFLFANRTTGSGT
jgi:FkbM family methyltransferase